MSRPSFDSAFPFTRQQVSAITGVTPPTVKILGTAFLKKKPHGTGNYLGFSMDDAVRIAVAKELLRVGVQSASLHELFEAIETTKAAAAKRWAWLRTSDARRQGAVLVMFLAPRSAPTQTGA